MPNCPIAGTGCPVMGAGCVPVLLGGTNVGDGCIPPKFKVEFENAPIPGNWP